VLFGYRDCWARTVPSIGVGRGPGSARFEELLYTLMREAEQFGGVATAETACGEDSRGALRLSLRVGAGSLGFGPGFVRLSGYFGEF
jgi:hypothetical protein